MEEKAYENGENTNILCIDCLKGRLVVINYPHSVCDKCGMKFIINKKNSFKYE